MGQEDRLKKQIDQLAKALANALTKLLGINGQADTFDAVEQVNQKLNDELKLDLDELATLPDETLINTLTYNYHLKNSHLSLLADITYTSAKLQPEAVSSKQLRQKALIMYQHLAATEKNYSLEWHNKIVELDK